MSWELLSQIENPLNYKLRKWFHKITESLNDMEVLFHISAEETIDKYNYTALF